MDQLNKTHLNQILLMDHDSIQIPEDTTMIHQLLEYLKLNSAAHLHFKGKIKILVAKTFQ